MLTSTRYQISYPDPATRADTADVPRDVAAVVAGLERSAMYGQGTLALRPTSTAGTPGIQGRFYYASDVNIMHYDFGTGWVETAGRATQYAALYPGASVHYDIVVNPTNLVANSRVLTYSIGTETQPRFYIGTTGDFNWGPGGSTPPDTFLQRSGIGILATGALTFNNYIQGITLPSNQPAIQLYQTGDTVSRLTLRSNGQIEWSTGAAAADVTLNKTGAALLTTNSAFQANVNISLLSTNSGHAYWTGMNTNLSNAWIMDASGGTFRWFNPIYRSNTSWLQLSMDSSYDGFIDNSISGGTTGGTSARLFLNWGGSANTASGVAVGNSWGGYGPLFAASFTVSSMASMKRDIESLDPHEALKRVLHQRVASFNFKHDAEDHPTRYGLIADEAHEAFIVRTEMPHQGDHAKYQQWHREAAEALAAGEEVVGEPPDIRQVESVGLDLNSMIGTLFGAVQALHERVAALEKAA